jgi:hypothetical protein
MTTRQECGDGVSIAMIGDGTNKRHFGNFLGIIFVPPRGGWEWHALNGDWGEVNTDEEAISEIIAAWDR